MSWIDIQEKAFRGWTNQYLTRRGMNVESLYTDLSDGLALIALVEELTHPKTVGRYNKKTKLPFQKLENIGIVLKFLEKEGLKMVNIGPEDIMNGNQRIILGLIWSLILRYQISLGKGDGDGADGSAKDELLKWVQSKIPDYNIKNFKGDWLDGKAINALVDALNPGLSPNHASLGGTDAERAQKGLDIAYDEWGVPKIMTGEEFGKDEMSMMTYIAMLRDVDPSKGASKLGPAPGEDAAKSSAYGPGLIEGTVGQPGEFVVSTPPDTKDKLEIKVYGPPDMGVLLPNDKVLVTPKGDGKYDVVYEPDQPGTYKIVVTLGGFDIPGSPFIVEVLEDFSLGGKGKIIVIYSTTSSTNKAKNDVVKMQKLLEMKKIHERPDFEPWVPVDVLSRNDREAMFKQAKTRELPIVYIDDTYVGTFDTLLALEKDRNAQGISKLDQLLRYNPNIEWVGGNPQKK